MLVPKTCDLHSRINVGLQRIIIDSVEVMASLCDSTVSTNAIRTLINHIETEIVGLRKIILEVESWNQ